MRITFYGAAQTTTGSMHLLEVNGNRIVLDCGLFQGRRKEAFERNRNFPIEPDSIDAVVLSHAHIDHSGNLPTLVRNGYQGPIYATPATIDLCEIMLLDSAYLQEKDVEYVNRKRKAQGKNPFEPLYKQEDARHTMEHFDAVPYENPCEVAPGVKINYHDAGHILGAAFTVVEITEGDLTRRLLYTGDIGRRRMPILRDPVIVRDIDLLITESTYGDRIHPPEEDVKARLETLCKRIVKRQSRLIIPAFSVGRTQQILYLLHELWEEERLGEIPVYVDSPLSTRATAVYKDHPECYDRDMMAHLMEHDSPFTMGKISCVTDVEESKKLNTMQGPVIVISASGMCEGGRILHHLRFSVEDERNIILIVGYQAEHTLGRRIVERQSPIKIFGDPYTLRAEVHSIQALSAHADRNEMLDYFRDMGPEVDRTFVVHGEPEQQEPFAEALGELGMENIMIPERETSVEF